MNGYGEFTWPNGRVYKGQWSEGKQCGEGIIVDENGKTRKGEWANGKRVQWIDNEES